MRVRLIVSPQCRSGCGKKRRCGSSRGKYLAFTDDDCAPRKDWLQAIAGAFPEAPDAIIGGPTINTLTDNLYSVARPTAHRYHPFVLQTD